MIEPVPITGFSLCNALGNDARTVRNALYDGRSGLAPCQDPMLFPFPTCVGAVTGTLPELPAVLAPWATRTAQIMLALVNGLEAQLQGLRARHRANRIAIVLGTSTAGADVTERAYRSYVQEGKLPEGYDLWRHHTYGAVLHVLRALTGAEGPAWMVSTACTSSAKPLASAQRLISTGMVDAAIVGGVDTLCAMTLRGFHCLDSLSPSACKPFASDRDGISIGEGGALLVLEKGGDAVALLEAVGESSDAYHISAPHPEGSGAELAMRRALAMAGCPPSAVDYVNAHGTGTRLNDTAEGLAIERVFGREVPVVSTKGYTGHTLGGAGATEACFAILALLEGWIPKSVGAEPMDERLHINVAQARLERKVRRAISNSFAFGGNNVSVLVRGV